MSVPLGAAINLALQTATLAILLLGLRAGVRTHRALRARAESARRLEGVHMNLMTAAVALSGVGLVLWMVPNFLFGWMYGPGLLGYGSGGYASYLSYGGAPLPHAFLILVHVGLGSLVAFLGAFLVVRMRWGPRSASLSIGNYRYVMIATWTLWVANILVGYAVFYFYVLVGTG